MKPNPEYWARLAAGLDRLADAAPPKLQPYLRGRNRTIVGACAATALVALIAGIVVLRSAPPPPPPAAPVAAAPTTQIAAVPVEKEAPWEPALMQDTLALLSEYVRHQNQIGELPAIGQMKPETLLADVRSTRPGTAGHLLQQLTQLTQQWRAQDEAVMTLDPYLSSYSRMTPSHRKTLYLQLLAVRNERRDLSDKLETQVNERVEQALAQYRPVVEGDYPYEVRTAYYNYLSKLEEARTALVAAVNNRRGLEILNRVQTAVADLPPPVTPGVPATLPQAPKEPVAPATGEQ